MPSMVVSVVGVVNFWWRRNVRVVVVVLVVQRLLDSVLFLVEQAAHLVDQVFVGGDVQIDQRLKDFFAVIVLGHLEGDQGINVQRAEIEAVGRDRTEVGILSRMWAVGIEGISVGGIGESEGDAERWLNLLAQHPSDALCAIEVQKTLKQYCKLFLCQNFESVLFVVLCSLGCYLNSKI